MKMLAWEILIIQQYDNIFSRYHRTGSVGVSEMRKGWHTSAKYIYQRLACQVSTTLVVGANQSHVNSTPGRLTHCKYEVVGGGWWMEAACINIKFFRKYPFILQTTIECVVSHYIIIQVFDEK